MNRQQRSLSLLITTITVVGLVVLGSGDGTKSTPFSLFTPQSADAQSAIPDGALQQVYKQLPDLPLENKYVNQETKKVNPENTLVSRLIRYHLYVKGRTPIYRLDWKLTLADYLGANDLMEDMAYPGSDTLTQNPLDGDRAAISRLNRKQRDALVQTLVNIFNPNSEAGVKPQSTNPDATPSLAPQPQPGAAELLKP